MSKLSVMVVFASFGMMAGAVEVSSVEALQAALSAAQDGEEIVIRAGTYSFGSGTSFMEGANWLVVSKSIRLVGETSGHWGDTVVFRGDKTTHGRALLVKSGAKAVVSGITFEDFFGSVDGTHGMAIAFADAWATGGIAENAYATNCVIRNCKTNPGSNKTSSAALYNGLAVDCLIEENYSYWAAVRNTRLIDCTLRHNTDARYSGTTYDPHGVYGCTFEKCDARDGSAIYFRDFTVPYDVVGCVFANNAASSGGLICYEQTGVVHPGEIRECTFVANAVGSTSASGLLYYGKNPSSTYNLVVSNCTFTANTNLNNFAEKGALFCTTTPKFAYDFADCVFSNNYVKGHGMLNHGKARRCSFVGNIGDGATGFGSCGYPASGFELTFENCWFDGNYSYRSGGAFYCGDGGVLNLKSCAVTNSFVYNDGASYRGGVLYAAAGSKVRIEGPSSFAKCHAAYAGGAIFVEGGADFFCSDATFDANTPMRMGDFNKTSGSGYPGGQCFGGVYSNCMFRNGTAAIPGLCGAVASGCVFENNYGGGSHNLVGDAFNCTLEDCVLRSGGIWQCRLSRCTVTAASKLSTFFGSNWATNCLVCGCTGSTWGFIYRSTDTVGVTDYLVETATTTSSYVNCTFADNAYGSYPLIQSDGQHYCIVLENCIFWNNRKSGARADIGISTKIQQNEVSLQNCLYGNVVSQSGAVTMRDLGGNVVGTDKDPLFVSAAEVTEQQPVYSLKKKRSPAYDAGRNEPWMASSTDRAGNARIFQNRIVDIGCYEYSVPSAGMMLIYR